MIGFCTNTLFRHGVWIRCVVREYVYKVKNPDLSKSKLK